MSTHLAADLLSPVRRNWYLAYSKPRSEHIVCSQLERQAYDAYLPRYKVHKRGPAGMVTASMPMFPRYVFFRPVRDGQSIAPVRSTVGVSGIVRFGQQPAVMADMLIDALRAFEREREMLDPAEALKFRADARVRICKGPLQGLEGLVSTVARDRVNVLLEIMGRPQSLALKLHELEVVQA